MTARNNKGFSLLEALVVMAIAVVLTVVWITVLPGVLNNSAVDAGYSQTIGALRTARQLAIDQMEQVQVTISGSGTSPATLTYSNQTPGGSTSNSNFSGSSSQTITVTLPVRVQFALPSSSGPTTAPESVPSTEWTISNSVPVSFSPIVTTGSTSTYTATGTNPGYYIVFQPDGTAQCPNTAAAAPLPIAGVCNGVIYLMDVKGDPSTLKAITLFGQTGRIAGYRYTGGGWTPY